MLLQWGRNEWNKTCSEQLSVPSFFSFFLCFSFFGDWESGISFSLSYKHQFLNCYCKLQITLKKTWKMEKAKKQALRKCWTRVFSISDSVSLGFSEHFSVWLSLQIKTDSRRFQVSRTEMALLILFLSKINLGFSFLKINIFS